MYKPIPKFSLTCPMIWNLVLVTSRYCWIWTFVWKQISADVNKNSEIPRRCFFCNNHQESIYWPETCYWYTSISIPCDYDIFQLLLAKPFGSDQKNESSHKNLFLWTSVFLARAAVNWKQSIIYPFSFSQ